jgi:hypothetical protein
VPRNADGWLKPDALRTAGVPEQYAVVKDGKRHEVSLVHDDRQGGYVTQHVILTEDGVREVHAWQVGDKIRLARQQFRVIVLSLGGRA